MGFFAWSAPTLSFSPVWGHGTRESLYKGIFLIGLCFTPPVHPLEGLRCRTQLVGFLPCPLSSSLMQGWGRGTYRLCCDTYPNVLWSMFSKYLNPHIIQLLQMFSSWPSGVFCPHFQSFPGSSPFIEASSPCFLQKSWTN
jgi:hypothetical protein